MLPRLTNLGQAFCILLTMSGTVIRDVFADAGGSLEQQGVLYLLSSSSIVASKRMAFFPYSFWTPTSCSNSVNPPTPNFPSQHHSRTWRLPRNRKSTSAVPVPGNKYPEIRVVNLWCARIFWHKFCESLFPNISCLGQVPVVLMCYR